VTDKPIKDEVTYRAVKSWAEALDDAQAQLRAAKGRVKELSVAVRVCEQRVKSGDPWPGRSTDAVNP